MTTTIHNIKYGWLSGNTRDTYVLWSVRLGRAVFASVGVWLVYQIARQFIILNQGA